MEHTMSADTGVRERLATAIEAYLDGAIDNDALAAVLDAGDVVRDRTCAEIASEMDFFLSDFHPHKNEGRHKVSHDTEQAIRRWACLLRAGWVWPAGRKDTKSGLTGFVALLRDNLRIRSRLADNMHWPLGGPNEWLEWQSQNAQRESA